jgi:excisionase family DNA binding protein
MENGEKRWMKAGEVADYLSVHRVTVYRTLYAHRLPGVKLKGVGWRIDCQAIGSLDGRRDGRPNLGKIITI